MFLAHHAAACGECGRGVTAQGSEREGEVARTEDRYDTEWLEGSDELGVPRRWRTVDMRVGLGGKQRAITQRRGEHAQLECGSRHLADQSRRAKVALLIRNGHHIVDGSVKGIGDCLQCPRSILVGGMTPGAKGRFGRGGVLRHRELLRFER